MQKEQIIFMLIQSYPKFISVKKKLNIFSSTLRFVVVVTGHDIMMHYFIIIEHWKQNKMRISRNRIYY